MKDRAPTADEVTAFLKQETFWYSTMELSPGVFSPGLNIPTVSGPRQIIRQMNVAGLDCLDVGSVEGMLAVLMGRQGAKSVTAYDRIDWSSKIAFVKRCYGADFEYISGCNYFCFLDAAKKTRGFPFDFVNFSGVLYHMFDPLGGILRTRSLVRDGGFVLLETSALIREEVAVYFNDEGRLLPPPNYCVPTVAWLDYILRLCRLRPVDVLHSATENHAPSAHTRICVVCQAENTPLVFQDGRWDNHLVTDYADYIDWNDTRSTKARLNYTPLNKNIVFRDNQTADLFASMRAGEGIRYEPEECVLRLADRQ